MTLPSTHTHLQTAPARLVVLIVAVLCVCVSSASTSGDVEASAPGASPTTSGVVDLNPRPLGTPRTPSQASESARSPIDRSNAAPVGAPSWTSSPIVRTSAALGLVLVLIFVLAAVARRASRAGSPLAGAFGSARAPSGILEVLARYPLGRGQVLVLLKIDRRILLLSQSTGRIRSGGGGLSTLSEISDPDDVASILLKIQQSEGDSSADRFRHLLDRFDRQHDDGVQVVAAHPNVDGDDEPWPQPAQGLRLADVEATLALSRARALSDSAEAGARSTRRARS